MPELLTLTLDAASEYLRSTGPSQLFAVYFGSIGTLILFAAGRGIR
jgi:hypothetical protein